MTQAVRLDRHILDVLMRDLVGHDRQPAAFLVYLRLYYAAQRRRWRPVAASLRTIAEETGLSKSAVQLALENLRRRELIQSSSAHATALPQHLVLRHWRAPAAARSKSFPPRKRRQPRTR
jgi:DNA-binding transcriptional MocR family regulator